MTRKIIHIDMDAFYASIEQRDRPELRGRPVVVGSPRVERGVVAAASYEARRYGIHSAMPMIQAWRRCPDLCIVPPNFTKYRNISKQLREILVDYTDIIEPLSLDECYLDVTQDKRGIGSATWIAQQLRTRVREELGLTASAGAAPVKFVAKLASDEHKPDGLCVVPPERVIEFIHPLPVERLWGVGPATAEALHRMGLRRVEDVARCDVQKLVDVLGRRGAQIHAFSHGEDDREIITEREHKSRGAERTFLTSLETFSEVFTITLTLAEHLCAQLQREGEQARCVTIKVRHDDFTTITRSFSLTRPASHIEIWRDHLEKLVKRTRAGDVPIRLVGVSFSGLVGEGREGSDQPLQLSMDFAR